MKPVYIMIGGFLGAGKTTTIARLARHFVAQGKRIGIVTNDQTDDLVDTQTLRSQGFDVGEVADEEESKGSYRIREGMSDDLNDLIIDDVKATEKNKCGT